MGVPLKAELIATNDLSDLHDLDVLFSVAPAQHTRATLAARCDTTLTLGA